MRVFTGERKAKRKTAGMAAQQGGPVVLCIGKKSVKHDQLSLDVKGVHLKNELPSFVDQWGKVDWETVS